MNRTDNHRTDRHADKYIFIVCLVSALGLYIGSFFCPPMGEIHPSILKAGASLLGFAALAVIGQNLANGKDVTFRKDDIDIKIGEEDKKE